MKEKISVAKKLIIVASIIVFIFAVINLSWLLLVKVPYNRYAGKLEIIYDEDYGEEGEPGIRYQKEIDGYKYDSSMPDYLCFSGVLSVGSIDGSVVNMDGNGEIVGSNGLDITIFIWPGVFGKCEYGVDFYDEAADIWEQVMIDSDINYLPEDKGNVEVIEYIEGLISENYEEINKMLTGAKQLWDLK